jgi:hypothetical protein
MQYLPLLQASMQLHLSQYHQYEFFELGRQTIVERFATFPVPTALS